MIGLLQTIACLLQQIAYMALWAIVTGFNNVVAAIAAALTALLAILPGFPDIPGIPDQVSEYTAWINWFFPVGTLLEIIVWCGTVWLVWLAVSTILRWGRAL